MVIVVSGGALHARTAILPREVLDSLDSYNVVYSSMAKSGSNECMPLGNGDITANVWVEESRDLMLYIGKSDCWSEAGRLLKTGRVRISLTPNPFTEDSKFTQTLNLADGAIEIKAESAVGNFEMKVWVDAYAPVTRIDIKSDRKFSARASNDNMRGAPVTINRYNSDSFRGLAGSPVPVSEAADLVISDPESVIWAHRNESSPYNMILERQNVGELIGKYEDPYLYRTFGAEIGGTGLAKADDYTMESSAPSRTCSIYIKVLTAQTETLDSWVGKIKAIDASKADFKAHREWWRSFWNRSWIFVSGDEDAKVLTRGWLLQRFMIACQGRGQYPIKFNGGSLTFDYDGQNADYRRWGAGYWHQNTRLLYWPLIASGDMDMLMPWFDFYMRLLPFQRDVTKIQYGHEGAYFPETINFFGLYIQDDWGWDNPGEASDTRWIRYHWSGSLEVLAMMLEAYRYSLDRDFAKNYIIPFAEHSLRFFAEHWPKINHTLRFIPANSLEQYWDCLNPIDYIAGIKYDIGLLRQLPEGLVPEHLMKEWNELEKSLPGIPVRDGRILPAEEYGAGRNLENPELYAIFPFRLYDRDDDIALRTYNARIFNDSNTCWAQDNIQAAYLGLTEDAARYTVRKARALDGRGISFPGFWRAGSDYIPDLDNGGSMAMGLQTMLLQTIGGETAVLPSWPDRWKVWFKLQAEGGKTVEYRK